MKKLMIGAFVVGVAVHAALAADSIVATNGETVVKTGEVSCQSVSIGAGGGTVVFDGATVTAAGTLSCKAGNTGRIAFLNDTHAEFAGRTFFADADNKDTHVLVQVIDSYLKPAGAGSYYLGNNHADSTCVFAITNATFYSANELVAQDSTEFLCSNAIFTMTAQAKFGSTASSTASGRMVFVDSTFTAAAFFIGGGSRYDMLVSGGTASITTLFQCGWKQGGTSSGQPMGTVRFTDGATASIEEAWIADYTNAKATLAIDSGAVVTVGSQYSGGGLTVGRYGDGTIEINEGGTLKAWSIAGASQGGTCTLKANGGTFIARSYEPTKLHDEEIFRNDIAITVGEKGFVINTSGYDVKITKDITGGPVTFTGGGTVTIADGVTIDDFDAAGGTTIAYETEGSTETISVTAPGVTVQTADIAFNGNDTRIFDIATGSGLTVSGKVGIGAAEKRGGGILTLDNPNDKFVGGLTQTCGTLGFGENAPAKLNAKYVIGNTTAKTLTVIKSDGDIAMNFPSGTIKGAFLKRGAGELVWGRSAAWAQYNDLTGATAVKDLDPANPLDFGDGTELPTDNFAAFTVAEGRMTIRGTGSSRNSFRSLGVPWVVGTPVTSCAAQPELVFDNMSVTLDVLHIGAGLGAGTPVVEPKLTVLNSSLNCAFGTAQYVTDVALRPTVFVSNSTVTASSLCLNGQYDPATSKPLGSGKVRATHRYVAGSELLVSARLEYLFPVTLSFDNSTLSGETATTPVTLYSHPHCGTNTTVFANGSRFCFAGAAETHSSSAHLTERQTLVFDDATMDPATAEDFTYDIDTAHFNLYFEVRGKGLVFEPAAGQTITMAEALHGTGGFVNRGEGTSVLADGTVAYAGVTCAEAGAVDFDGVTLSGAKIAGPGAFRNGTLADPTLSLAMADAAVADAPALDFANGLALTGKVTVDLGLTPDKPITKVGGKYPVLTVATYTGSDAPDVSNWKLKAGQGIRGSFSAADGIVTCATEPVPGLVIIFR